MRLLSQELEEQKRDQPKIGEKEAGGRVKKISTLGFEELLFSSAMDGLRMKAEKQTTDENGPEAASSGGGAPAPAPALNAGGREERKGSARV